MLLGLSTSAWSFAPLAISQLLHNGEAAFAASAVATTLLHPLDTLKSRLQISSNEEWWNTKGLYSGLAENVLKEAPDAAVFLALSEQVFQTLSHNSWFAAHIPLALLLSGAFGDAVGSVVRLPAEVACKRLQTGVATDLGGALQSVSMENWRSAWTAILCRDVPMGGLQIALFHQTRECSLLLAQSLPDTMSDVLAGVVAGAVAAALTTPLDVCVTLASTRDDDDNDHNNDNGQRQQRYYDGQNNHAHIGIVDLVRTRGPGSLTRGIGLRTLYYAPLIGCFFALYEHFRLLLDATS